MGASDHRSGCGPRHVFSGFVLLLPLVFTIVASSGLPRCVTRPWWQRSVTHCFCRHIRTGAATASLSLRLISERLYCMDLSLPFRQYCRRTAVFKLLTRFEKAPLKAYLILICLAKRNALLLEQYFRCRDPVILILSAAVCRNYVTEN